jgi:hypothetical protein
MKSNLNEQPFINNIESLLLSLNNTNQNNFLNALNAAYINNALTLQLLNNYYSNIHSGNFHQNNNQRNIFYNLNILNQLINIYSVFNSTFNLNSLVHLNPNDYKINQNNINNFNVEEINSNKISEIYPVKDQKTISNINSCNEIESNSVSEKKEINDMLNKKLNREEFVKRRITKCPHTDHKHYAKVDYNLF